MVNPIYRLWLIFRSALFWLFFLPLTVISAIILPFLTIAPLSIRIGLVRVWIAISLFLLRFFCGLRYEISGLENIPDNGFIVMSKHSSTWETIVIQRFFKPMVWVVKKELTRIPFFGWGLIAMNAIALNRGTGRKAIKQLIDESRLRMDEGRILMLFPEGTRVLPGQTKPFKLGGAIVAEKTGYQILPIAHNAGEFWPRHSWIKWPGTIKMVVGQPIDPKGKKPEEIIKLVGEWITKTGDSISDAEQRRKIGM